MPSSSRRSIKNKKVLCGQCRMEVKEDKEDIIECDKCERMFHVVCAKLDKRQFDHLLKNKDEEYICYICDDSNASAGTVKEELQHIKAKLDKLDQLQESMNFMSTKFDEVLKGISENKKKIERIEKENQNLKMEVKNLKDSMKFLNDQRVKNDCIISGINYDSEKNAAQAVIEFSKTVGADIPKESIDDAYYLRNKTQTNPKTSLVVKFISKSAKDTFMAVKPQLKKKEETKSIYVNDFLSKESMHLLNYARSLKSIGFERVYSHSGRIFAKKNEITKPRLIRSEEDVNTILLDATTSRQYSRRVSQKPVPVLHDSDGSEDETQSQFISPVTIN